MAIKLKNSSNTEIYEFPSGCELMEEPFDFREDTEKRAYQDGAVVVADEKLEPRILTVQGIFDASCINTTYGATLLENLKKLKQQVRESTKSEVRLYPGSQFPDEYYIVKALHTEPRFLGMLEVVEISIDFLCADGYRHYKDVTTDTKDPVVSGTPYALTNDNDGDVEVSPIITFTAGGTITNIKIENAGDAGKYFEYSGIMAVDKKLVVDCKEGTVEYDGSSDMAHFTRSFIKLVSGTNTITITITGTLTNSICEFKFRKRWL